MAPPPTPQEHARLGRRCEELEDTVKSTEEETHQEREEMYGQTGQLQEKVCEYVGGCVSGCVFMYKGK